MANYLWAALLIFFPCRIALSQQNPEAASIEPNIIYVEVSINQKTLPGVTTIGILGDQIWFPESRWEETGIEKSGINAQRIIDNANYFALNPAIKFELDMAKLSLDLNVPVNLMKHYVVGDENKTTENSSSIFAWYWNHQSYFNHDLKQHQVSFVTHHSGNILIPYGVINNTLLTGFFRESYNITRLDTSYTIDLASYNLRLIIGDSLSEAPSWSTARALAGFKLQKGYFLYRDTPIYPTINLFGSLVHDGQIEVMVDGSVRFKKDLTMGNFMVDAPNLPLGNNRGALIIKDSQGIVNSIPFSYYADPESLRPGLTTFSYSVGFLRQNYGKTSFDYDGIAGLMNHKLGITNFWTTSVHGQIGLGHLVMGSEQRFRLFDSGTLALAYGASLKNDRYGYTLAAEIGFNQFFLDFKNRLTYASPLFQPLGVTDSQIGTDSFAMISTLRVPIDWLRKTTLSHLIWLKNPLQKNTFSLAQGFSIGNRMTLSLSVSYDFSQNNFMVMSLFSLSLEPRQFVSAGMEYTQDKLSSYGGYQIRSDPGKEHRFSIGALANYDYQATVRTFASYDNRYLQSRASATMGSQPLSYAADFANAFGMIGPKFFVTTPIQSSLALIHVPFASNVRVLRDRTAHVSTTDRNGFAVIKDLGSYQKVNLSFDTKKMDTSLKSSELEKDIKIQTGLNSAHRFNIAAPKIIRLIMTPQYRDKNLKTGTKITLDGTDAEGFVGPHGDVYLETTTLKDTISGKDETGLCHFSLDLSQPSEEIIRNLGSVECH